MKTLAWLTNDAYKLKLDYASEQKSVLPPVLAAAKNDTVSFQILLQADQRYCVNIGKSPWFSEKGPMPCIRTEVAAPYPASQRIEGMVKDDDDILKADILLPQMVREASANIPTAVWVDIHIPRNAPAGMAKVAVRIYASSLCEDETLIKTLEVEVDIRNYRMPESRDYSFYLDLWQHNSNIARKHEVKLWSDRHFEIMERYVKTLAALGQKSTTVVVSEAPWRGQSCSLNHRNPSNLFEYSIVGITREPDGTFHYDYRAMQRYIDLCKKYGIDGDIEIFGLINIWSIKEIDDSPVCGEYPENILLRYYNRADGSFRYIRSAKDIEDYIAGLERYFIATGQIDRVRIAADEPADLNRYRESLRKIKSIAPHFRFKTAINHAEFIKEFPDDISDFVPYISCLCQENGALKEYRKRMPEKRFLWYVCCGPDHLNTFIRNNLLESRFIGIFTSFVGLDGFLRWNYTVWPEDPRGDIRYGNFPAGDTNFVYPSRGGDVLLSLRYKQLKKGIEDFELLSRLKKAGCTETVQQVYDMLIRTRDISLYFSPDFLPIEAICSLEYDDYNRARSMMLKALEKAEPDTEGFVQ